MKSTLGKIFLLLLLECFALGDTNLATYSLHANKQNVTLKEAIEITFEAQQQDHTDAMFFFLEAKISPDYKIELLKNEEKELSHHHKKSIFTFLVFPLKAGEIAVNFEFIIKQASDEGVAQIYYGGRLNSKWIETVNTPIKLEPILLKVEDIDKDTELVGDFKIVTKIKEENIKAYESANITYYLEGIGYDEIAITPIEAIQDVKIFSNITKHFNKATQDGYQVQREFNYALVADKDFTIKEKKIKCYSPKSDTYYVISTKPYTLKVDKHESSTLIDTENYPQTNQSFEGIKQFFISLLLFLSGFISAKLLPKSFIKISTKRKWSDIEETKTPKELLVLLMNSYQEYQLEATYKELEALLYKGKSEKNFKTIKKELLKRLP